MPDFPTRWSAEDIIEWYPKLGIPHFQRGLVWGAESESLLLESLFYGTPCGELVLWQPQDPTKEGIPLDPAQRPEYLILDGQQRIRSVWGALVPAMKGVESGGGDGQESGDHAIWCLNLCQVPELQKYFDAGARSRLFHRTRDPYPWKSKARNIYNLVPLTRFFNDLPVEIKLIQVKNKEDLHAVLKGIEELRQSVKDLPKHFVFGVPKPLVEEEKRHKLADVVAFYNRINSGGMRVELEEKAFATLVSLRPNETSTWLRDVFEKIHGTDKSPNRDTILKRQKERSFGFKLFIRTFVQVCAYHFGYSVGSNSFSFNVVEGMEFQKLRASEQSIKMFAQTKEILLYVKGKLAELHCDDLRALPETTSLLPVFQLLIRYPDLMDCEAAAPIVRYMMLRLLLLPVNDQRETFRLVFTINGSQTAKECLAELRDTLALSDDFGTSEFDKRLKTSRSLQDQYVRMLYWLVRRKGARDFSYRNLTDEKRKQMLRKYDPEVIVDQTVVPQKQHIVPYSKLRVIYGNIEGGRLSNHRVNDIGNLTYISAALNDYITGLGADPVRLEYEPRENLEGHFLAGKNADNLGSLYQSVIVPGESDALSPRESYEKFCDDRQKLIARGFADWLREETPTWSLDRRIRPTPRLFPPYAYKEDRIRALNYPAELEDTLLAHVDNPKFRLDKGQSNEPPKLINLRDDSKRTVQLKPLQDRIEITAKNEAADPRMSRLAVAGGLEVISETQWHLRIDSTPPAAAASVLSTLLDEVLGAKS